MTPEVLAEIVARVITENLQEIRTQLNAVEARVEGLAQQSASVTYAGIYESEKEYHPGELTTRGGSLWLCIKGTRGAPGTDADGWRLVVKQGKA